MGEMVKQALLPDMERYQLETGARTSEGHLVVLRAAYAVGPKTDAGDDDKPDEEDHRLLLHQPLLLHAKDPAAAPRRGRVEELVRRHVRALAGGMTASQMFAMGSGSFVREVLGRVQPDAGKLGLSVCSADVEMLQVHVPTDTLPEEAMKKLEEAEARNRALERQAAGSKLLVAELQELVDRVRADTSRTKDDAESVVNDLMESIQALKVRIDCSEAGARNVLLVAGSRKVVPLAVQEQPAGVAAAPAEGKDEMPWSPSSRATCSSAYSPSSSEDTSNIVSALSAAPPSDPAARELDP